MLSNDEEIESFGLDKGRFQELEVREIYDIINNSKYSVFPGDSTANAIVAFSLNYMKDKNLEKKTTINRRISNETMNISYIGKIGNDNDGMFYKKELEKANIKPYLIYGEKPTGVCLALISEDSERTFAVDLGSSTTLSKKDIIENNLIQVIKKHKIFHFTGYQLTNRDMREAILYVIKNVKDTMLVSFDLGDPNVVKNFKAIVMEIISYADIVFANREEAYELFEIDIPSELAIKLGQYTDVAVVKDGINGSYIYSKKEDKAHKIKPYPVEAVDTTGAGDAYAGTFLYYYLIGEDLDKAGDYASRIAAKAVKKMGGRLDFI